MQTITSPLNLTRRLGHTPGMSRSDKQDSLVQLPQDTLSLGEAPPDAGMSLATRLKGLGMLALAVAGGGALTGCGSSQSTQSLQQNAQDTHTQAENQAALDNLSSQGFDGGTPGLHKEGVFGSDLIDSSKALQMLQKGEKVSVKNANGSFSKIYGFADLHELDALQGRGGSTPTLKAEEQKLLKALEKGVDSNDGFYQNGTKATAYDALQNLQNNSGISLNLGRGEGARVSSFADLHKVDVIYGSTTNDLMPAQQLDALHSLEAGHNLGQGGATAYDAFNQLQRGQGVTASMTGGVYGSRLTTEVKTMGDLSTAQTRIENQKEADKYRPSREQLALLASTPLDSLSSSIGEQVKDAEVAQAKAEGLPYTVSQSYEITPAQGDKAAVVGTRQVANSKRASALKQAHEDLQQARDNASKLASLKSAATRLRYSSGNATDTEVDIRMALKDLQRSVGENSSLTDQIKQIESLINTLRRPEAPANWTPQTPLMQNL